MIVSLITILWPVDVTQKTKENLIIIKKWTAPSVLHTLFQVNHEIVMFNKV